MTKNKYQLQIIWIGLAVICVVSIFINLHIGSMSFSTADIFSILMGNEHSQKSIILDIRLPRAILAMTTGAILSICGFYMQALVKNPLADPYLMGVTSGAGLGVNLLYANIIGITTFHLFTFPLFAWVGSFAALLFVILLGARGFSETSDRLLLAGVACSSICTALTGVLIYRFSQKDQMRRVIFWTFGSFDKATLEIAEVSIILFICCFFAGIFFSRKLDILSLGDLQAQTLGLNTQTTKYQLLVLCSLFTGGIVAFTGPIGFVGMMIPHFSRALVGHSHRINIFVATLLGASYLLTCDTISRLFIQPTGLPIGIVTALLGVPFFLFLLNKKTF